MTNTLADRDELIGQVIANLNTVLGSLGGQSDQFDKAVDSLSELVEALAARKTDISNAVAYTNAAAGHHRRPARPGPRRLCRKAGARKPTAPPASWSPTTTTSTTCSTRCPTPTRRWAARACTATSSASTCATSC